MPLPELGEDVRPEVSRIRHLRYRLDVYVLDGQPLSFSMTMRDVKKQKTKSLGGQTGGDMKDMLQDVGLRIGWGIDEEN